MFDLSIARMHNQAGLFSWVWIPFIYYDATMFSASKDLPFAGNGLDGYQAISHTGVGPLFCVQWISERSITKDATFVESRDQTSVGWLLYQAKHGRVATPFGDRLTDGHKVLGIGPVSTVYEPKEDPAKQAAGRSGTEKAK